MASTTRGIIPFISIYILSTTSLMITVGNITPSVDWSIKLSGRIPQNYFIYCVRSAVPCHYLRSKHAAIKAAVIAAVRATTFHPNCCCNACHYTSVNQYFTSGWKAVYWEMQYLLHSYLWGNVNRKENWACRPAVCSLFWWITYDFSQREQSREILTSNIASFLDSSSRKWHSYIHTPPGQCFTLVNAGQFKLNELCVWYRHGGCYTKHLWKLRRYFCYMWPAERKPGTCRKYWIRVRDNFIRTGRF